METGRNPRTQVSAARFRRQGRAWRAPEGPKSRPGAAPGLHLVMTFLAVVTAAWSDYNPPTGSGAYYDLASPDFLGRGSSVVSSDSPYADAVNPAASGANQRPTFDLSYIGLAGLGSQSGFGSALGLGLTVPTRVGVFTGTGRLVSVPATLTSLDLGTVGGVNLSFSKDVYPRLLVGVGLGFLVGSNGGNATDWGLDLDLGLVHKPGDLGFLKDFTWAVVARDIGKGYTPVAGATSFPAPFTPALGLSFDLVRVPAVSWGWTLDLSFPTFQNVRVDGSTRFGIQDTVFFTLAGHFDLHETLGTFTDPATPSPRALPITFGIGVRLRTDLKTQTGVIKERGWNRSQVDVNVGAAPLQDDIWGFGLGMNLALGEVDRTGPEVLITADETIYISPLVSGTSDEMILPVTITDTRYVKEYELEIFDAAGTPVRAVGEREVLTENFFQRLGYVETQIPLPESIRWDGMSNAGAPVPDGTYTYTVRAVDDNGNTTQSTASRVVVDNTPPEAQATAEYLVFSPNGDGNKDLLPLRLSGSLEDLWAAAIQDASGTQIRRWSFEAAAPGPIDWDGLTDDGILAPDGAYSFRIGSTDRAGNQGAAGIDSIEINTRPTPVDLAIDKAFFSPNGDRERDTVVISLEVPVTSGIERWSLTVGNRAQGGVRTYEGGTEISRSIVFDGMNQAGARLPEGDYTAVLDVRYLNGNNPRATSSTFTLDLTRPTVTTRADFSLFSPNGDGRRDEVTIQQESSEEVLWSGEIKDAAGAVVYGLTWRGRVDPRVVWNGRGPEGQLLADGRYAYVVKTTDRAGNFGQSDPLVLELNTEDTQVFLSTDLSHFSPNADRIKDRIRILPQLRVTEGIRDYELAVLNEADTTVRTLSGRTVAPEPFAWDGLDDAGRRSPDGAYRAEFRITYTKGDEHSVRVGPFYLDTAAPQIDLSVADLLFSPEGDGRKDTVTVVQSSTEEDLWEAEVRDAAGAAVRGFFWKGKAADAAWDGRDDVGNRVPDGLYGYRVGATDRAGNSVLKEIAGIEIDTRETPAYASVQSAAFSPNGDGVRDDQAVKLILGLKEGIETWKLDIRHQTAGIQRAYTSETSIPAQINWDGKRADGSAAPEGVYTAKLEVEYLKGNLPTSTTTPFNLDVSPPQVTQTLSGPFSPDEDGVNDVLTISTTVQDLSAIERWSMRIIDPQAAAFATFGGTGAPDARLTWNGISPEGVRARDATTYRLQVALEDAAGNAVAAQQSFPVSVLLPFVQLAPPAGRVVFSPEGDGQKDTLTIGQQSSPERAWTGEIRDAAGRVVRSFTWSGRLPEMVWDGKDNAGANAADGLYGYIVRAPRRADIAPEARVAEIRVDRRPTPLSVRVSAARFSPNGDGRMDAVDVGLSPGVTDGVATWKVDMMHETGGIQRTFGGTGTPPSTQRWDGRTDAGAVAPEGAYSAEVSLVYEKGNRPTERTTPVDLDVTPPRATLSMNPRPFSPDADGTDDVLAVDLGAVDTGTVVRWALRILDPTQQPFMEFGAAGAPPARLTWDGLSRQGELVQAATDYPVVLTVEDDAGNVAEVKDLLPIDVLVIREGDRLKIRISSITFPPNLSDLSRVAEQTDRDRNARTLRRIAEILNKFSTYRIRIEGHANSVFFYDAARARREQTEELLPLSTARANAVKDVLVQYGVSADRITTAGLGGSEPVVPFRDTPNVWKNRRVEFVLTERG